MILGKRVHVKEAKPARNWLRSLALAFGLYLIWTLAKGVVELRTAYGRIDEAKRVLEGEKIKSQDLGNKWAKVQTPEYLEEVARNDLNMQREGETVVLLPTVRKVDEGEKGLDQEKELKNWEKWWNLVK